MAFASRLYNAVLGPTGPTTITTLTVESVAPAGAGCRADSPKRPMARTTARHSPTARADDGMRLLSVRRCRGQPPLSGFLTRPQAGMGRAPSMTEIGRECLRRLHHCRRHRELRVA